MKSCTKFVVMSGLPASGKTLLAHQLAPVLGLPVIDKDDILERLFSQRGAGDLTWRRTLSRESDSILQGEAKASAGAVLVSFWHRTGMPEDSGTPADWLTSLTGPSVHVHCVCPPETAADRYFQRRRHPGHLDDSRSRDEVLASLQTIAKLPPIQVGLRIDVDTTRPVDVDALAAEVRAAFRN